MTASAVHPGWRVAGPALAIAFVLLGVLFRDTHLSFFHLWNNSDSYGHGLFIVPISLYAVWLLRAPLLATEPRPWPPAVLAIMALTAAWAAAWLMGIEVGHQLAVALLIPALVLALAGWRVTCLLAFPLAYPLLAVPIWEVLVTPLQYQTAAVSTWALQSAGVPVFLEDIHLAIPSGNFIIAEVCAGLRYLMAMAAIAAFYAFLNGLTLRAGLAFFALALVWAVLFNWIRVTTIIAIGHISEMQHSIVHDHYTLGWVLFAVCLVPLFYAGRWFPVAAAPKVEVPPGAQAGSRPRAVLVLALACVMLAAGPLASSRLLAMQPAGPFELGWPGLTEAGWPQPEPAPDAWSPVFPGAAGSAVAAYRRAGDEQPVLAFVALYGREAQGAELINSTNALHDPQRWQRGGAGLAGARGALAGHVRELVLRDRRGNMRVLWYAYRAGGGFQHGRLRIKLAQLRNLVQGRPAGAVLALARDVRGEDLTAARESLGGAAEQLLPAMLQELAATGLD